MRLFLAALLFFILVYDDAKVFKHLHQQVVEVLIKQ
jgi:hypothetical protein